MERIPTTMALSQRGVKIETNNCSACIGESECANHVLIKCPFAATVIQKIIRWCGVTTCNIQNIDELIQFAANWSRCPKKRKRFNEICYGMLWGIWRARNERLFQERFANPCGVVDNINATVYTWIKCRGKKFNCNWEDFCTFPFLF